MSLDAAGMSACATSFRAGLFGRQRFDVLDQLDNVLFRDQAPECRHDRLISVYYFGSRVQDGFANVGLIGVYGFPAGQQYRLSEEPLETGTPARTIVFV